MTEQTSQTPAAPRKINEVRVYEVTTGDETMIIKRLVDVNTNVSTYFGQAIRIVEMQTPQGPMRGNQNVVFPIDGATSPENAADMAKDAFEKFRAAELNQTQPKNIIVPGPGLPNVPPNGFGQLPGGPRFNGRRI